MTYPAVLSSTNPHPKAISRSLIHIPIIHTQEDMGALGQAVQEITIQKLGQEGWERNVILIKKIWDSIEQAIESWSLPYPKVRLYQDGLPICGREQEIVTELAKIGSRNHQLLLRLHGKGAAIMGTESADLLMKEYKLIKQVLQIPIQKWQRGWRPARKAPAMLYSNNEINSSRNGSTALFVRVKPDCFSWACFIRWPPSLPKILTSRGRVTFHLNRKNKVVGDLHLDRLPLLRTGSGAILSFRSGSIEWFFQE